MKAGLTPKQKQVYDYLRLYHRVHGCFPSVREIGEGKIEGEQVLTRRTSPTSVHRYLKALEERGWIQVMPGRARSITIL